MQARGGVKRRVRVMKQVSGRVVDVEQDRVVGPSRAVRIESNPVHGGDEEITTHQRDPVIGGQTGCVRK